MTMRPHLPGLLAGPGGAVFTPAQTFPSGIAAIDACLPGGGLARGALHEVGGDDFRAMPAGWGFLIALALRGLEEREGHVLWPILQHTEHHFGAPHGPGLQALGLDPARLVFAWCRTPRDFLWALEEGARGQGFAALIAARPPRMTLTQSRRLQLAAAASGKPAFLLRHHDDHEPSAARTRWRVAPLQGARDPSGFLNAFRWQVTLEQARGGRSGTWRVEWNHDTHRFDLSALLADRADDQGTAPPARHAAS